MSFGLERDHASMQKEILEAYSKNIIIFAAASNNGGNYDVTYPARKNEVICIYSTDGNGNTSHCNPTHLKNSGYHFATLGVGVKSAWPKHLHEKSEGERRMTGTSFATPIAAGIAACILEFARMHKIEDDLYKVLRSREGMQEVFAQHLVDKRGDLHYIHPWKLFANHRSDEEILLQIKDPLKRWVGKTEKETEMR
jgi:Subtilase family